MVKKPQGDIIHDGVNTGDQDQGEECGETQSPDDCHRGGTDKWISSPDHISYRYQTENSSNGGEKNRTETEAAALNNG